MAAAERRYARALFEAAQERNRLEEVQRDLSDFVDAVREVPELRALLRDPVLDRRVKIAALSDVLAGSDELVRNFVLVLTEQGRAGELEETEREFERFLADETGRLSLELATAIELSDEEAGQIVQQIERASGRNVEATRRVDPDLLGGVVLQVGSLRLDASLRGRLERLRRELRTYLRRNLEATPEEITSILKQRIEDFDVETNLSEVGTVLQVGDGIARLYGLENAVALEMLELEHGVVGLAFNLEEDNVGAALFGEWEHVREGEPVRRTGRVASVPVGDALLGRVVDPLGRPLDGQGPIQTEETRQLEFKAPGVVDRQPVKEPLQTGLKAIDSMIPIGRGQRELILGDRSTGKTAILVDTILNQRDTDVVCIYVAIGQKASTVAQVYERLRDAGAMEYTIIVTAAANEAAPIKWMAPYAGCAMGEHVMFNGGHSLLMYDDLSKHADAYRQMSLLLRRPPGREAFPGDVFYLHSRLLERACKLNDEFGAGSLTALPVIETQAGDVAAYIPTNVISITDGQIYLETDLFFSGIRPAIDVGRSVSRVGGNAQVRAMRKVAGRLRLDLSQYRELEAFAQFGSELDATTQAALGRGERMVATLNQPQYDPWPTEEQVVALYAGINGYLDDIPAEDVPRFQNELREYMKTDKTILGEIRESGDISDDLEKQLREAIERFKETFAVTEQETVAA